MNEPWGVSIIVVNYNHAEFLAAAIDSALGQTHPLCEVIVVDDCSTDKSREVIARYGDRVTSVLREMNEGQTAALNSAWPLARHRILVFLNSDDLLLPHAAATVTARWTATAVKMQFLLLTIDAVGQETGQVAPKYPPNLDTATLRAELLRTGGSPNSPSSGNAYSRSLLEMVARDGGFDMQNVREHWMDAILECNAPFYGEVVTLYEPLACYRVHGRNLYAVTSVTDTHFKMLLRTFEFKLGCLTRRCSSWGVPFDGVAVRNRSPWALECELVLAKLASAKEHRPSFTRLYTIIKSYLGGPRVAPGALTPGYASEVAFVPVGDEDEVPDHVQSKTRLQATRFLGFVEDLEPIFQNVRIGIVAERTGGGFKLKSLDYIFNRVPIAAIAGGIAGLPLTPGVDYLSFATMRELAQGIVAVIDNSEQLNSLQQTAYKKCESAFDWSDRGRLFFDAIQRAANRQGAAHAGRLPT